VCELNDMLRVVCVHTGKPAGLMLQIGQFCNHMKNELHFKWNKFQKINHIHQQMHTVGLLTVRKIYIAPTCFGSETPSLGSLEYNGVQAPVHETGRDSTIHVLRCC